MHRYINDPNQSWNKGVLFQLHKSQYAKQNKITNSSLLIQLTSKANEIALIAFGPEAKTLQGIIAAELDELNRSFAGLQDKVQQQVPCVCSQCKTSADPYFYRVRTLLNFKEKGRHHAVCELSAEDVPVAELLEGLPKTNKPPHEEQYEEQYERQQQDRQRHSAASISEFPATNSEPPTIAAPVTRNANTGLQTLTLFLASSSELEAERDAFQMFLSQQNNRLVKQGIYIELIRWEYFLDAIAEQGLQNEYNKQVRASDIFVSLFKTKVGKYTEEEFDQAFAQFSETQTPKIYTYFYQGSIEVAEVNRDGVNSLFDFKQKLEDHGHYCSHFKNIDHLKLQFRDQLDRLLPQLIPTK